MGLLTLLADDLTETLDPVQYIRSLKNVNCPEPYGWQRRILTTQHKRLHINGARRGGKSVIISARPCHLSKTQPRAVTLILGPTETQAVEDMRLIRAFMQSDKTYPKIIRSSDSQVELSNGSRIIVVPATEISARGYPNPDLIITDESAYIDNNIHEDCVVPMLSENPHCVWIQISTTNGKVGDPGEFFFKTSHSEDWERYEVRAPWDIDPMDNMSLIPYMPEAEYISIKAAQGITACYSPRHANIEEQLFILRHQGPDKYRRNQLCEFVEPEEQVFSYADIARAFESDSKPLSTEITETDTPALHII